ncbi:23S rRNA (uracil(1939)-C(5))-methyltransferase RlmD [Nitrococcus mobilis]|uniref:23S rRNA (uracil(1939)-C(5))-methyltransferase RlmD n=1 Tax=Nitrococcus mobilis Nb-231 TaxID=314278 RepID=A4BS02_9GAMM|nr:23S rRNA (uracil(1939)-C(5))-methyltransferase RlmD [Nitrococcus mobilis]EAR21481.1 23S rRNA methyltransferase/RumA [Nitrococcus mobilis Nb-231]
MNQPRRRRLPQQPLEAEVSALSHEGRGIAHVEGKITFVRGALAGERVRLRYTKRHRQWDEGKLLEVLRPAPERVEPGCIHFGVCGGCALQHLTPQQQLTFKETVVREKLRHMGGVEPSTWLAPLGSPAWGYRRKARLAVKYVAGKDDRVLVGFRETHSTLVADLASCRVLDPRIGAHIPQLAETIRCLSIFDRVPQIEVAAGDQAVGLVFRNLAPFTVEDYRLLSAFARQYDFYVYEQPGDKASVRPIWPRAPQLSYALPDHAVSVFFEPTDFTQVNPAVNHALVERAIALLALQPQDRVLDLYCGLGNFAFCIARQVASVVGLEGDDALVERARENAARNAITNVVFQRADLSRGIAELAHLQRDGVSRVLLDPPRSGAAEVLADIAALRAERIVYVSCGPSTLARDAGRLVHEYGYRLAAAGVMDMFPHTAHVECITLFVRDQAGDVP